MAQLAHAGKPGAAPSALPILMWGVYQDCTLDRSATDAVRLRLQQMGESVTPVAADRQSAECSGSDCARRLPGDGVARGRLFGGRWRRGADGETYVRLWLTNLASGETAYADGSCASCEVSELLARQAANLSERDLAASARSPAAGSEERPAAASAANDGVPPGRKRIGIAINSKGGSLSTMMLISAAASKTLRQMGYEVVAAKGMGQGAPSSDLALLDITVAHDKSSGSSSIIMRHSAPGGAQTSLNLDCGALNCQAGQIERLARLNIGTLLDSATTERTPPVSSLVPTARTRSPLEDTIDCRKLLATRTAEAPDSGATGAPAGSAESITAGSPAKPAATATHTRYSPFLQPRRIAGLVLIGASIVGFGVSGWLVGQNGKLTDDYSCTLGLLPGQQCRLNTSAAFGIGFALSGVSLISGAMLIALPNKNEN